MRLPEDVAQEVAHILVQGRVVNPHKYTLDYVCSIVRIGLLRDSIAWIRFMRGEPCKS